MTVSQYKSAKLICGCDEAGRGALAGPVVASAVILPKKKIIQDLNDSKKISKRLRYKLSEIIKKESVAWAIGVIDVNEIDSINILNSSIKAMHLAIKKIIKKLRGNPPDLLLIDGNRFQPYNDIEYKCIVRGDSKYSSIAAASILAKTYRDDLMIKLGEKYPEYNWTQNKGYPTKEHKIKILHSGINKHHRKSFKLLDIQYTLRF